MILQKVVERSHVVLFETAPHEVQFGEISVEEGRIANVLEGVLHGIDEALNSEVNVPVNRKELDSYFLVCEQINFKKQNHILLVG